MLKDNVKFLAICILLGSIILSAAIIFYALSGRYSLLKVGDSPTITFDHLTGDCYYEKDSKNKKLNFIKEYEAGK